MRLALFFSLALIPIAIQAQTANKPVKPRQLGLCTACHGVDGRSRVAGTPHLNAQDRLYLANALRAYRNGSRKAQPMNAIANSLQPRDIEQLAAWYAAQPAGAKR